MVGYSPLHHHFRGKGMLNFRNPAVKCRCIRVFPGLFFQYVTYVFRYVRQYGDGAHSGPHIGTDVDLVDVEEVSLRVQLGIPLLVTFYFQGADADIQAPIIKFQEGEKGIRHEKADPIFIFLCVNP